MTSITRYYLVVGDTADNGAVIMTGARSKHRGKNDAHEGSDVFCPVCKTTGVLKCVGPRISRKDMGVQIALSGDICICKCPRHPVFLVGRRNYGMTVDTTAAWCLHLGETIGLTTTDAGLSPNEDHAMKFDQFFQLIDEKTGEILKNRFYKIHCPSGVIAGYTDTSGFTKKITSNEAEEIKIEIFGEEI
ncbi:PAAR domain-containing protein [Collimonas antrihumi]|uniref:PAAR domain-containing protein n=1 Tax=Collimonas antrihumi TaxID=1940615 RepID=UPI001B8B7AB8|nr:PAAR domain-containing protein [Collimonas antrihumi]